MLIVLQVVVLGGLFAWVMRRGRQRPAADPALRRSRWPVSGPWSVPGIGPTWLPNGPWALAAAGLASVALVGFGGATTLPADRRWLWFAVPAALGSVAALAAASRRRADGFIGRWPAISAVTVALLGLSAGLFLGGGGSVGAVAFLGWLVALGAAVAAVPSLLRSVVRQRWDALAAVALVAGAAALFATVDLVEVRLDGPGGDRLAAEAEALAADPSVVEQEAWGPNHPLVIAGTDRRLVAWKLAESIDTQLLVHDPDGLLEEVGPDGLFAGELNHCAHKTGPWWICTYG